MTPGDLSPRRRGHDALRSPSRPRRLAGCWLPRPNAACARCALATAQPSWSAICERNFTPRRCIVTMRRCGSMSNRCWPPFAARTPSIDLPLDVRATAFQMKVWETLRQIPRGETRSYSEVAREIGDPQRGSRGGPRLRLESGRVGRALSSRGPQRRRLGGIPLGRRAKEEAAGAGADKLLSSHARCPGAVGTTLRPDDLSVKACSVLNSYSRFGTAAYRLLSHLFAAHLYLPVSCVLQSAVV